MARKVSQMSPTTLIKKAVEKNQKTVWIAGLKIDKSAGDETQYISTFYVEPQQVEVDIRERSKWGGEFSADRVTLLNVELPDKSIEKRMDRWRANQHGVKYFKDEEHAKKYFLVVTKNLYDSTVGANMAYKNIHEELSVKSPTFVQDLDNL